jgi:hypothetical protein
MRTTIVLPPELLRQAKVRAAQRGESLKSFMTRAVEAELGRRGERTTRVVLPLLGHPAGPRRRITNEDIARALADDDAAVASGAERRRPARASKRA